MHLRLAARVLYKCVCWAWWLSAAHSCLTQLAAFAGQLPALLSLLGATAAASGRAEQAAGCQ